MRLKCKAKVIKQKLDNMGPNMHWAGVSEYEEVIDVLGIHFSDGKVDYVTDSMGDYVTDSMGDEYGGTALLELIMNIGPRTVTLTKGVDM